MRLPLTLVTLRYTFCVSCGFCDTAAVVPDAVAERALPPACYLAFCRTVARCLAVYALPLQLQNLAGPPRIRTPARLVTHPLRLLPYLYRWTLQFPAAFPIACWTLPLAVGLVEHYTCGTTRTFRARFTTLVPPYLPVTRIGLDCLIGYTFSPVRRHTTL